MIGSMHRLDILRINWLWNAWWQAEALGQVYAHHSFEAIQDQALFDRALGNQTITMFPIFDPEYPIGRNAVPQFDIAQWGQPFFDFFNVFKNNHLSNLPDCCFQTQISEARELPHEL